MRKGCCTARLAALGAMLLCGACAVVQPARAPEPKSEPAGVVEGYLPKALLASIGSVVPPPPAPGSAAHAADDDAFRAMQKLNGTPRWTLAIRDAEYRFPRAVDAFACALGVRIGETETPDLYRLMRRTFVDAGLAGSGAKAPYRRPRPFVAGDVPICTPEMAPAFRKDSSYPSSNAAIGWAWGLVLAEVAPERLQSLVARGYEFGHSRAVCGVHWHSDIDAGRLLGAVVVAQLHSSGEFLKQLAAARREVEATRGHAPAPECEAEREAIRK